MIEINGNNLDIGKFIKVVKHHEKVKISETSKAKVDVASAYVKQVVESEVPTYGINTGFGKLSDVSISKKDVSTLQENLLKSHACGVGEPFSEDVVRGMLLLRINALVKGNSGIRLSVIEKMVEFLNKNLVPVVFSQGSLGASGDLAMLSHMALPLLGLGEVYFKSERMSSETGLKMAGITPIDKLYAKEGLSLINGTQAMTSVAALALHEAFELINLSQQTLAITFEALRGITDVFDAEVHAMRNHRGQSVIAKNILQLLNGSKLTTKQGELRVQDAYSLRCSPQVLGASLDAFNHIKSVVEAEMNAVTDNPIVFSEREKVISAGNFHGQPIALVMDFLAISASEIANISERRIERMVNANLSNNLPPFLVKVPGLNSGFMIVQYSAASLVSENKSLAHPASVDSIPSSANQEDHVSMGTIAARKARQIIDNAHKAVSMELLTALQAVDFRGSELLSPQDSQIYRHIRKEIPFIEHDTIMYPYIHRIDQISRQSDFINLIELECE